MRCVLISVLAIAAAAPSHADDLADLPDIACAQASTPLEREQIGCPLPEAATRVATKPATAADRRDEPVQPAQRGQPAQRDKAAD